MQLHRTTANQNITSKNLALSKVATEWLTRWQPTAIYRAFLADTSPAQVPEAAGMSVRYVSGRWKLWVEAQRHLSIDGKAAVTEDQYVTVRARFAEATSGLLL